ncbi:unnamed protein product [Lactuca saligna]|uniref:Uncharacterized protein n=1 Tax=Lactuca saligna TaxID=75948 RepID=A0AA36EMH4_LACSI|nr:unnamed protein product [Lactuca saligna]
MVEEKNLYEFGRLTDKTFSDGEKSNEGWSEDEFIHGKKASDIFYGMSPIPDCPDPIVEPGPFHSLGPNDDIFVRQIFSSTRPQVVAYLIEIPRAKWTIAYSSSKRYDYMTSNSAESMNALSVDARKMPIIPLLEFFRRLSQEWCYKHRIEGGERSTVLTEWAEKVVSKNEERTTGCDLSGIGPKETKKARKTSTVSGSNTKGKGKGTEGIQEMLETHRTQETRWMSGTRREDYCSTFDLND